MFILKKGAMMLAASSVLLSSSAAVAFSDPEGNDASCVSLTFDLPVDEDGYFTAEPGQVFTGTFLAENTGTTTWVPGEYFPYHPYDWLTWISPDDPPVLLETTEPGQIGTSTFTARALSFPGLLPFNLRMLKIYHGDFGEICVARIRVQNAM